jgi:hypothetical protein
VCGTIGREGVVVDCAPSGTAIHTIASGVALHAVTRIAGGALVACGDRGTICIIRHDEKGKVITAHAAGKSSLRALAPFGAGFVAVGERGALVSVPHATGEALAASTEVTFASEDLSTVQTRAKFICALGALVHIASRDTIARAASAQVGGRIRDFYLDNGVIRVVSDDAAVLEAIVTGVTDAL